MAEYINFTDDELLSLLRNDDRLAFNEIYRRYWKKMLLIAWNHSNDKTAAKDIVHDVFISLWERSSTVEILNLGAFLATSIKFSVFKCCQKESRREELFKQNYKFEEFTQDENKLDALFLQEFINGIVEEMPDKCRLVFKYSREQGMKNAEIADKIEITEKGVEANLTRALKIIRGELKNYGWIILLVIHTIYSLFK